MSDIAFINMYEEDQVPSWDGNCYQYVGVFVGAENTPRKTWAFPLPGADSHDELRCDAYWSAVCFCAADGLEIVLIDGDEPILPLMYMIAYNDPKGAPRRPSEVSNE